MGNSHPGDDSIIESNSTGHVFSGQPGKKALTCFERDTTNEISENVSVIPTDID